MYSMIDDALIVRFAGAFIPDRCVVINLGTIAICRCLCQNDCIERLVVERKTVHVGHYKSIFRIPGDAQVSCPSGERSELPIGYQANGLFREFDICLAPFDGFDKNEVLGTR